MILGRTRAQKKQCLQLFVSHRGYLMLMFLRARLVRIRGNARVRGAFPGCIQLPEVFRLDDQFTARHRPYTDNRDKNLIIPA